MIYFHSSLEDVYFNILTNNVPKAVTAETSSANKEFQQLEAITINFNVTNRILSHDK